MPFGAIPSSRAASLPTQCRKKLAQVNDHHRTQGIRSETYDKDFSIDTRGTSRYIVSMGTGPKGEQRDAMREQLGLFARDAARFRPGIQLTESCTSCAYHVVEHFGGQVLGYFHAHNELARIGETEGGHDFAITPEGFLVDAWVFHCHGEEPVLDLSAADDRAEATARYGRDENWQKLAKSPEARPRESGREYKLNMLKAG